MVCFSLHDLKTPVDLFQQKDSDHLMGKGHSGKGKLEVRTPGYFLG